jgi:GntR family transcriptional regulator, transcriptional repressor for pyruvate dehydrogenase complex
MTNQVKRKVIAAGIAGSNVGPSPGHGRTGVAPSGAAGPACDPHWREAADIRGREEPQDAVDAPLAVRENAIMLASPGRTGRVSEVIVRRIKKQILDGRLAAGQKLPAERDMARQFKTSRVSVREAYRSLEELGLLRIRRGAEGGAFIVKFNHEPVLRSLSLVLGLGKTSHQELTEARMLIEPSLARLAALRAGPDDIARLEQVIVHEEGEAHRESAHFHPTGLQFHRSLADCTRNLPLIVMMNALADLLADAVSGLDVKARARHRKKNCEYHRLIFNAVRQHDDQAAHNLMVRHVGDIQGRVHRTIRQQCSTVSVDDELRAAKAVRARRPRVASNGRSR